MPSKNASLDFVPIVGSIQEIAIQAAMAVEYGQWLFSAPERVVARRAWNSTEMSLIDFERIYARLVATATSPVCVPLNHIRARMYVALLLAYACE